MDEDEKPTTTPESTRVAEELAEVKRALGRLANATLKIHYQQQGTHKLVVQGDRTLERIERKVGENGERLAVLLKEVDNTQDDVADLRDDITPPLGTPLVPAVAAPAPHDEDDPVLGVGPVKMPHSMWKRAIPYIVVGLLCAGIAAILVTLAFVLPHAR